MLFTREPRNTHRPDLDALRNTPGPSPGERGDRPRLRHGCSNCHPRTKQMLCKWLLRSIFKFVFFKNCIGFVFFLNIFNPQVGESRMRNPWARRPLHRSQQLPQLCSVLLFKTSATRVSPPRGSARGAAPQLLAWDGLGCKPPAGTEMWKTWQVRDHTWLRLGEFRGWGADLGIRDESQQGAGRAPPPQMLSVMILLHQKQTFLQSEMLF